MQPPRDRHATLCADLIQRTPSDATPTQRHTAPEALAASSELSVERKSRRYTMGILTNSRSRNSDAAAGPVMLMRALERQPPVVRLQELTSSGVRATDIGGKKTDP